MTRAGDYDDEMRAFRHGLHDEAIDDLLAGGQPVDERLTALADFVEAVRSHAAAAPPSPSRELAGVLSEGLTTDKGELPATAASNATVPANAQESGLPKWTRRTRMIIETALAKLAALGLTAKVGVASAAVAAATTGAGAAGVLPGPLQDVVADVVGAVTPIDLPSGSDVEPVEVDDEVEPEQLDAEEEVVEEEATEEESPDEGSGFGDRVSDDATGDADGQPGVDGADVADEASEGRSGGDPTEADEGRATAEDNRENAADNGDAGVTEAENNAPDEADAHIPDESPADNPPTSAPERSTPPQDAPETSDEPTETDRPDSAPTTDDDATDDEAVPAPPTPGGEAGGGAAGRG